MPDTSAPLAYPNPLRERLGAAFFAAIPQAPGIYFMHSGSGALLYIGKAKQLRVRLRSYARARPGAVPDRTLELVENIAEIRWQVCRSEADALKREYALLHAVRPPYNLRHTDEDHYLMIGCRRQERRMHFRLASHALEADFRYFGSYRPWRLTKLGYTALLRLLHAATRPPGTRFATPARIGGESPPYVYAADFRPEWERPLLDFLGGRSQRLLRLLVTELLESDDIPRFMRRSLQEDLELVRRFFREGPGATRTLRLRHRLRGHYVPPDEMDRLITRELAPGLATGPA